MVILPAKRNYDWWHERCTEGVTEAPNFNPSPPASEVTRSFGLG
jgi:hypothetical protein